MAIGMSWQLAVVDYDFIKLDDCPLLKSTIQNVKQTAAVPQGEIAYVVSIFVKQIEKLSSKFAELKQRPMYTKFGVTFAYIYLPRTHQYAFILSECLRPILNEKDAIEVETQMGISLKDYV